MSTVHDTDALSHDILSAGIGSLNVDGTEPKRLRFSVDLAQPWLTQVLTIWKLPCQKNAI